MSVPRSGSVEGRGTLKAYIAGSEGVDTGALRSLLASEGVIASDAFGSEIVGAVRGSLLERIRSADVVIAVISRDSWVAYEMGICDALRKPVLLLLMPNSEPPAYLSGHQHLRTDLKSTDLLRLTLKKFVE